MVIPTLKADFALRIATREARRARRQPDSQIVVDAKGTYAGQPITGRLIGGALLSLRDAQHPYPVDLKLANGPTHVSLAGTLTDPLTFGGADLKLELAGADMRDLYHLTGIPIPETPAYRIAGQLDYADHKFRFHGFRGVVGSSDLHGTIEEEPGQERPMVTADLASTKVDLADLGGFIGATPGRQSTANQSAAQKQEFARTEANPRLLPDTPINLPKLRAADVKLRYRGEHILGRSVPLDNLVVNLSILDGKIALEPISFGVGRGRIAGTAALDGTGDVIRAKAAVDFDHVDVARLMAATHMFGGAGAIGGHADIVTSGNSVAQMLGNGDGRTAAADDRGRFERATGRSVRPGVRQRASVRSGYPETHACRMHDRRFLAAEGAAQYAHVAAGDQGSKRARHRLGGSAQRDDQLQAEHGGGAFQHRLAAYADRHQRPAEKPEHPPGSRASWRCAAELPPHLAVVLPPLAILPTIEFGQDESRECAARISSVRPSERAKAVPVTAAPVPARRRGR